MSDFKLSKRLSAAASFVRDGAVCADIGTDHAYLPISLVLSGKAKYAIASDINEGPILKARENVEKYGLNDRICTRVAAGLDGIEQYKPDYILICGMGGELIAKILDASEYVKNKSVKLILQPMTSIKELREYLSCGFLIYDEEIVLDSGKLYQIICAEYDGNDHLFSETELELGKINIINKEPLFKDFVNNLLNKKLKKMEGLKTGGYDIKSIEEEIKEIEKLI